MKIGICDDELDVRIKAKQILEDTMFSSEEDVIELMTPEDVSIDLENKMFDCDLLILDIEFLHSSFNGIDLAKIINEASPDCQIIYLTHILEFAPEVYETKHCYFVMKNNMEVMLPRAMKKAKGIYGKVQKRKHICVVCDGVKEYFAQKDILYLEKIQRKIYIHTKQKNYESYQSLSSVLRQMDDEMVRCHGSFIVNIQYIANLGSTEIVMEDGTSIPIGKTYREQTKHQYLRYWMERE